MTELLAAIGSLSTVDDITAVFTLALWLRGALLDRTSAIEAKVAAEETGASYRTERDLATEQLVTRTTERDAALERLADAQAALAAAEKELADARVHADPAGALAGVLHEELVPTGNAGHPTAGHDGGGAAPVRAPGVADEPRARSGAGPGR